MSGHSKWNNIKNKKEKTDAQKAKVFTKIGKEIAIAVREGGGNPDTNRKLKDLIAKAKASNVPNDNIERAIKEAVADDRAENAVHPVSRSSLKLRLTTGTERAAISVTFLTSTAGTSVRRVAFRIFFPIRE